MRLRFGALAVTALVVGSGCGGENGGTPPGVRGDLTVSFVESASDLGAVLLTVTGGEVEVATAIPGGVVVSFASPSPGVTRIVVSGALAPGDFLRLRVPDVNAVSAYAIRIDQSAHAETFALVDPALSSFSIRR
jgi:hypothetical protein